MKRLLRALAVVSAVTGLLIGGAVPVAAHEGHEGEVHIHAGVDIKPGSETNPINLGSRGKVAVVLFGGAAELVEGSGVESPFVLDVTQVDTATVELHPMGEGGHERAISPVRFAFEDVNRDGVTDLVFHFLIADIAVNFTVDDMEACLHGNLLVAAGGTHFCGSDAVRLF